MFCENCGYKLKEDSCFCENCGVELEKHFFKPDKNNQNIKIILAVLIPMVIILGIVGIIKWHITSGRKGNEVEKYVGNNTQTITAPVENEFVYCKFIQTELYEKGLVTKEEYIPTIILYTDKRFKFISNEYSGMATYYGYWFEEKGSYMFIIDSYEYNEGLEPISEILDSVIIDTEFTIRKDFDGKTAEMVSNSKIGMTGVSGTSFYVDNSDTEEIDFNNILKNTSVISDSTPSLEDNNSQIELDTRVKIGMHRSQIEKLWGKPFMEKRKDDQILCFYRDKNNNIRMVGYYSDNVCGALLP